MKRRLIFFAEGSSTIGRGHLSRCLAICMMIDDLVDISFVCLTSNKLFVEQYTAPYPIISLDTYDRVDAIVRIDDIVWIDNYNIGQKTKASLSKLAHRVIETNDIPADTTFIDILINHTPGLARSAFQKNGDTKYYLGLNYALLRPSFLKYAREQEEEVIGDGIFICFGGADTFDLGYQYVKELRKANFDGPIYWVTNKEYEDIQEGENLWILGGLSEDQMIFYMRKAKILLIPSSVLSIEAIALRRPIFTTNFVSNQDLIFQGLISNNLAAGVPSIQDAPQVIQSLQSLLEFYSNKRTHSICYSNQVTSIDGLSKDRIRDMINLLDS